MTNSKAGIGDILAVDLNAFYGPCFLPEIVGAKHLAVIDFPAAGYGGVT